MEVWLQVYFFRYSWKGAEREPSTENINEKWNMHGSTSWFYFPMFELLRQCYIYWLAIFQPFMCAKVT